MLTTDVDFGSQAERADKNGRMGSKVSRRREQRRNQEQ